MTIDYRALVDGKRNWQPSFTPSESGKDGTADTLARALALAGLELEVMDWVLGCRDEASKLGPEAIYALEQNAADEVKHDRVLQLAMSAYQVGQSYLDSAQAVIGQWKDHPDHPIVKVALLESSIFFVILPMYRFFGGPSLRTASRDISGDETVHVRTHLEIAKSLGFGWSYSLDKLRRDTVGYLVENLACGGAYGSKDFWHESSHSLMHTGSAKQLAATKAAVVPAFFETDGRSLPSY